MAMLYCVEVSFKNQQFPALLSIRVNGTDLCCIVRYVDKHLPHVLPGDVLIISPYKGVKQPSYLPRELAEAFVACTYQAVRSFNKGQA
jgi:hypothetical protein